jgi:L-amino acid N-acyltransferase YncA
VELRDATLMLVRESADQPVVAALAQSVYQALAEGETVGYQLLDELIGEASGKGVLRALHARYSPAACEAIIRPILMEIDRLKPVPPRR